MAPDTGFATVADSAWITIAGPTLIGFHPIVTNARLEADEDLTTVLDDFAYHLGSAIDSLVARGYAVHYRGGDTLWLRAGDRRWRVIRPPDSADVGYLFADRPGRQVMLFGVRSYLDLIENGHTFALTGRIPAP